VDRRAEVRWFRAAFAAELFGGGPTFHWGLVVKEIG
jgi:hypothetical protein